MLRSPSSNEVVNKDGPFDAQSRRRRPERPLVSGPVIGSSLSSFAPTVSNVGNQIAGWRWDYLDLQTPAAPSSLVAVWQFDGTGNQLTDLTGSAAWLLNRGTLFNGKVSNLVGLTFSGIASGEQYTAGLAAPLHLLGAMTIEIQYILRNISGVADSILSCFAVGEAEAQNYLYEVAVLPSSGRIQYFHEYGAGTNFVYYPPMIASVGRIELLTITRAVDGTVSAYQDGYFCGSTVAPSLPTGGGSSHVWMGDESGSNFPFEGTVFSMRFSNVAFTAAQVAAETARLRYL